MTDSKALREFAEWCRDAQPGTPYPPDFYGKVVALGNAYLSLTADKGAESAAREMVMAEMECQTPCAAPCTCSRLTAALTATAAAAEARERERALRDIHDELGTIKWIGALHRVCVIHADAWDQAIAAVRKHIAAIRGGDNG